MPTMTRATVWSLVVLMLAGCSSSPANSEPPAASEPASAAQSPLPPTATVAPMASGPVEQTPAASYPADDPRSLGDAVYTAAGEPLELQVELDVDASAAADIGPEGGTLTSTGSDGTTFTLTIPANALALVVPVTMTPIASATGFPGEAPDHNIGVNLTPDGLELAETATLLIEPAVDLPPENVFGLSYRGAGEDAGFHLFDRVEGGVTLSIDHFSGYEISFPIFIANEPAAFVRKYMSQAEVEARLASEVAYWVTFLRQHELLGRQAPFTQHQLASYVLPLFKRLVIAPRVAVADRSCAEAHAAIEAYVTYQRQRQLLGVGDDPAFDLVGAGLFVPEALVDLGVSVCFREAYARCHETGEFPALAAYFMAFFRRVVLLGLEPNSEHVAVARDYLTRCGRWRVHVLTTHIDDAPKSSNFDHHEASRDFHVQWQPSEGLYGIVGARIEGSGPVETTHLDRSTAACRHTISNVTASADAAARITLLSFDHYEGPTLTGDPIPPVPKKLTLEIVSYGEVSYHHGCPPVGAQYDVVQKFEWLGFINGQKRGLDPLEIVLQQREGTFLAKYEGDWRFRTKPYRATTVQDATLYPGGEELGWSVYARTEIVVEHEPE